jgi:hypothetical protein
VASASMARPTLTERNSLITRLVYDLLTCLLHDESRTTFIRTERCRQKQKIKGASAQASANRNSQVRYASRYTLPFRDQANCTYQSSPREANLFGNDSALLCVVADGTSACVHVLCIQSPPQATKWLADDLGFLAERVYARFGFVFAYTPRLDLAVRSDTITMVHAGDLF